MRRDNLFVKLVKIEKEDFGFYGNDCEYSIEIYKDKKFLLGEADMTVVQMGVDYSDAYDFLYDYDPTDEDDCQSLAEILGVDSIDENWLDEDGQIDVDCLPQEIIEHLENEYDETLLDCYYEEFAEMTGEDDFVSLPDFAENYKFKTWSGKLVNLDLELPLSEMFEKVNGGFYQNEVDVETMACDVIDILDAEGRKTFAGLATLIAAEMDNMDMVSSYIDVRYDGEYSREERAYKEMKFIYVEMAYVILRSLMPVMNYYDLLDWQDEVAGTLNNICKSLGVVYDDNESSDFDDLSEEVSQYCSGQRATADASQEMADFIEELVKKGVYPMSDAKYTKLLQERGIE